MKKALISGFAAMLLMQAGSAYADGGVSFDKADTLWVLISTALVMLMVPGLALFYAGMARRKNALSMMMQSFFMLGLIGVSWVVWGYTLSFGPDVMGVIGSVKHALFSFGGADLGGRTIPNEVFAIFQGMFAVVTVALITGGVAERMRFSAIALFSLLWLTFVYVPLCHWVWGGGWLSSLGVMDFAGGLVVHVSSGFSALTACIVVGKRHNYGRELMAPHNLPLTLLGMGLLWFGWFGFNAGSALGVNDVAVMSFVTTNVSAAAGVLSWTVIEKLHRGKPTLLGAVSGAVAGLGSITGCAGFVGVGAAMIVGLAGGALCYYAVSVLKVKFKYDDTLDVFGIHGIAGMWGIASLGLFGSIGVEGLFSSGSAHFLFVQLMGVIVTALFSVAATLALLKITGKITKLRVSREDEVEGLDLSEHGESGYNP
ncbi:MAG: ammonium transporter [Deltaproteobacteria bacterium]|nr:ammonium transporter [Deltaproteobacteria bacterium]